MAATWGYGIRELLYHRRLTTFQPRDAKSYMIGGSGPKLQLDPAVPMNPSRLQDRLQIGFLYVNLHILEVIQKRLDSLRHGFRGRDPSPLNLQPAAQLGLALLQRGLPTSQRLVRLDELLLVEDISSEEVQMLQELRFQV